MRITINVDETVNETSLLPTCKELTPEVDRKIKTTMENGYQIIASRMYADELRKKLGVKPFLWGMGVFHEINLWGMEFFTIFAP